MEDTFPHLPKPEPLPYDAGKEELKPQTSINALPDEVLAHAFRFLSQKDRYVSVRGTGLSGKQECTCMCTCMGVFTYFKDHC